MLTLHLLSVLFSGCVVFLADKQGLAWMRGKSPTLDPKRLRVYHYLTWTGLGLLIVTGFFLFYPMAGYLLHNPLFIIKMLFVGVLIANGALIHSLQKVATERTFASLSFEERLPLFTSGAVSGFSWVSAFVLAFFLV